MVDPKEIETQNTDNSHATPTSLCVRYYAGAAQAARTDEASVEVTPDMTLAQVAQAGTSQPLGALLEVSSFLVDGQLRPGTATVADLPESIRLEVLPPFAGG